MTTHEKGPNLKYPGMFDRHLWGMVPTVLSASDTGGGCRNYSLPAASMPRDASGSVHTALPVGFKQQFGCPGESSNPKTAALIVKTNKLKGLRERT